MMGQKMARILPATEVDAIVPQTGTHEPVAQNALEERDAERWEAFVVAIDDGTAAGAAAVRRRRQVRSPRCR